MADGQDLAWDFTGERLDHSPLIRDGQSVFYSVNSERESYLTRGQVENILKNLEDTADLLHTYLQNAPQPRPITKPEPSCSTNRCTSCFCWRALIWVKHKAEDYIFFFSLILQFLNVLLLSLLDLWPNKAEDKLAISVSTFVMFFLQIINLLGLLTASGKLLKAVVGGKRKLRLVQNYLATILVFAGLYTLTYRLDKKSWTFILPNVILDPVLIIELYMRMIFLSVATATLCGSSNITPKAWYNYVILGTQMLISFIYFSQILAQATDVHKNRSSTSRHGRQGRRNSSASKSSILNMTGDSTVEHSGEEMISPLCRRHSQ